MSKSIMYVITWCERLVPYMEGKYITDNKRIANTSFKAKCKLHYYVTMSKEVTTKTVIKKQFTGHS